MFPVQRPSEVEHSNPSQFSGRLTFSAGLSDRLVRSAVFMSGACRFGERSRRCFQRQAM